MKVALKKFYLYRIDDVLLQYNTDLHSIHLMITKELTVFRPKTSNLHIPRSITYHVFYKDEKTIKKNITELEDGKA